MSSALICPECGGPKTHQAPKCRKCRYPIERLPERYGRWTVLGHAGRVSGVMMINVRCECGNIRTVHLKHLRSGKSASCGCVGGTFSHGQAKGRPTPEYR